MTDSYRHSIAAIPIVAPPPHHTPRKLVMYQSFPGGFSVRFFGSDFKNYVFLDEKISESQTGVKSVLLICFISLLFLQTKFILVDIKYRVYAKIHVCSESVI